jgi:molecular chaperone DnaJ
MGASGFGGGFPGGFGGAPGGGTYQTVDIGDLGDLGDLCGSMFGGAGGRTGRRTQSRVRRGADLETDVRLSFDDAMAGVTIPVTLDGPAVCTTCHGSGAAPGTSPVICATCGGGGTVAVNQGFFQMEQTCPTCAGTGRTIETPCPTCHGTGATRRSRTVRVKIPAGVKDGARIKVPGRGEPGGPGAPAGDLYVRVRVAPHPVFGRKGDNLTVELPVSYPEAALGANVQVPTLNGPVTLKVPAGTESGKTFRVKGKGAPKRGGRGDLMVTVHVDVPKKLSKREKELLDELRDAETAPPRAGLGV